MEEATASRGRTQRFIERFSTVWTPGAMAASLLVILVPPLFLGGEWGTWLYRGLALLLVACPAPSSSPCPPRWRPASRRARGTGCW
ncbi:hypothetical protein ACE7GA_00255 [Roseomonas sp. CCTCC AB2023176]|uniref:hypothetical protein n=1 Tax=Roseomonas sp. CCTCC AB2023176 TaxID=3342640 RepID=UPI0035DDED12